MYAPRHLPNWEACARLHGPPDTAYARIDGHGSPFTATSTGNSAAAAHDRAPLRGGPVRAGARRRQPPPERSPDLGAGRHGAGPLAGAGHRLRLTAGPDATRVHPARGALRHRGHRYAYGV